jgi:hypothetical protein
MFRITALVLLLIAVGAPAVAEASRKPTRQEAKSLAKKMGRDVPTRCLRIRISTKSKSLTWAGVRFRLTDSSCNKWNADGVGVFKRRRSRPHGSWRFVTAGSSFDCPVPKVPSRVAKDLKIPCEPGSG